LSLVFVTRSEMSEANAESASDLAVTSAEIAASLSLILVLAVTISEAIAVSADTRAEVSVDIAEVFVPTTASRATILCAKAPSPSALADCSARK